MEEFEFQHPWAMLLLLAIPVVVYAKRKYVTTTGFSNVALLGRDLGPNGVKEYGPDFLGGLFMIASVLAVANIQYASYETGG